MTHQHAIEVDRVSKRYRLGEYHSAKSVGEAAAAVVHRLGRRRVRPEEIWSLRDVSFTLEEGRALGVIGRNGAGKSTLLKILSRITEPTSGVARTRGRVAALLEVGTGFHGELTGRENMFLNGAILGMSRREMARRFDEIVSFAGVERFIDTPVKRYSSGMYLRLAFSVAAHIEPDILVVDEVLAVGDAEFQAKCVGRMHTAEREGRTVVFVSHNLDAVMQLCTEGIWLERGVVTAEGRTESVVDAYVAAAVGEDHGAAPLMHTGDVTLDGVRLLDESGHPTRSLRRDRPFAIEVTYTVNERVPALDMSVLVFNASGTRVLDEAWSDTEGSRPDRPGTYTVRVSVPPVLNVGEYRIGIWVGTAYEMVLFQPAVTTFRLEGSTKGRPERAVALFLHWDVVDGPAKGSTVEVDSRSSGSAG
jgi:ABC-2 type transport system ATP-binding protein/lipopolysaccharide transport system ATP-binding protein